jgi:ACS family tartrate transporter-like MFS transporter
MIVYLTHWFCLRDRCRAIACFYIAIPTASLVGSPLAGWLLGVHWWQLGGWRWLFILEGIPAILLGIITIFYLTDWPSQARWLPVEERKWLSDQLESESHAKKTTRSYTIAQAFCDGRILLLTAIFFIALSAALGNIYWIPTFLKRLSGLPDRTVTLLLLVPAVIGVAGMLGNGWHADKKAERRWHASLPLFIAGALYALAILAGRNSNLTIVLLLLASGAYYAFNPVFWSIPTMMLCESAAAATFGLINSVGNLGGFAGPYLVGVLNDWTHSLTASFALIAILYFGAASLILCLKISDPLQDAQHDPEIPSTLTLTPDQSG